MNHNGSKHNEIKYGHDRHDNQRQGQHGHGNDRRRHDQHRHAQNDLGRSTLGDPPASSSETSGPPRALPGSPPPPPLPTPAGDLANPPPPPVATNPAASPSTGLPTVSGTLETSTNLSPTIQSPAGLDAAGLDAADLTVSDSGGQVTFENTSTRDDSSPNIFSGVADTNERFNGRLAASEEELSNLFASIVENDLLIEDTDLLQVLVQARRDAAKLDVDSDFDLNLSELIRSNPSERGPIRSGFVDISEPIDDLLLDDLSREATGEVEEDETQASGHHAVQEFDENEARTPRPTPQHHQAGDVANDYRRLESAFSGETSLDTTAEDEPVARAGMVELAHEGASLPHGLPDQLAVSESPGDCQSSFLKVEGAVARYQAFDIGLPMVGEETVEESPPTDAAEAASPLTSADDSDDSPLNGNLPIIAALLAGLLSGYRQRRDSRTAEDVTAQWFIRK